MNHCTSCLEDVASPPPHPPPMKMKIPLIAALVAGLPMASSAFTLDAVGYEGSELSLNPLSIFVPGYGIVIFEAAAGSTLVVNSAYRKRQWIRRSVTEFRSE